MSISLVVILSIAMPILSSASLYHEHVHYGGQDAITAHNPVTRPPIKRQMPTRQTCGYLDGDPKLPRTAGIGWECRFDTAYGLWGFCPETVVAARDCGLAGYCVDKDACTEGCGRLQDMSGVTTVSCGSTDFCSTALLVNGPDQTYEYIACGATATTQILLPNPTSADITSTITSTTTAAPNPSPTSEIQSSNPQTPASDPTAGPSSPTASNMEGSPGSSQTNIGAIVGGVVGSIVVICTTIFGVFWIRRKNNTKKALEYPPDNTFPSAYGNGLTEMDAAESQKQLFGQWNGLPAPVEMDELDNATLKPVELPENNR